MKLIATFSTGDGCTWSYDHVFALEYESAEQLLLDCEAAVQLAVNERTLELKEYKEYNAGLEKLRANNKKVSHSEYADYVLENHRPWRDTQVNLFGRKWDLNTFWEGEGKQLVNLEIYTLDEWFEQNTVTL